MLATTEVTYCFYSLTFMDRISTYSQGEEDVSFGNLRIASLIFVNCVVLLTSSKWEFKHALKQLAAECEIARLIISTSKSESIVVV